MFFRPFRPGGHSLFLVVRGHIGASQRRGELAIHGMETSAFCAGFAPEIGGRKHLCYRWMKTVLEVAGVEFDRETHGPGVRPSTGPAEPARSKTGNG